MTRKMHTYTAHNIKPVLLLMLLATVLTVANRAAAQNCNSLVQPKFADAPGIYNQLPQHKIQFYCNFAYNAFYWSDTLPQNAVVYNISDVTCKATGTNIAQNQTINLDFFSYYAYNFDEFQNRNYHSFIYFRVGMGTSVRYLVLRDFNTIMNICMQLEQN